VPVPPGNLGAHLYLNASCGGAAEFKCKEGLADPNGYAAAVYLYAADIVLEQNAGPTASDVGGELASATTVRGTSAVTFSASDPASGVYEAVFSVDGQVVQTSPVNDNGGRCRDVGQTADGKPAFLYVQPCLASVSADAALDTARLTNGSHHLVVSVIDAAGNSAPVLDRQITVANPPPPCAPGAQGGVGASAQATLSASWRGGRSGDRILSRFGRPQVIVGRLTGPAGAPIAGAVIDAVATPKYSGGRPAPLAGPHTRTDGRFGIRLPGNLSSRTVCLAYRGAGGLIVSRTLTLSVRAGIASQVAPRTVSVGRSVFFSGRLVGGPVPPDGKQLVLEARSPGSTWIQFKVIRTNPRGRFRANYRFRFTGPADYQFRVLSESESDYPFAAGSSNVVGVHER
jgi:hypothetical protein